MCRRLVGVEGVCFLWGKGLFSAEVVGMYAVVRGDFGGVLGGSLGSDKGFGFFWAVI